MHLNTSFVIRSLHNINCIDIVTTIWMGTLVSRMIILKIQKDNRIKRNCQVIGQVGLGIIGGTVLYFNLLYGRT